MACRTLLRRRVQLDLLAEACRCKAAGEVFSRRNRQQCGPIRLMDCADGRIELRWERGPRPPEFVLPGHPVEVQFECAQQAYRFCSLTVGAPAGGPADAALFVRLPLRVEQLIRRRYPRVVLPEDLPVRCRLTHVMGRQQTFAGRLTDISLEGFATLLTAGDLPRVSPGDLFWARFESDGWPRLPSDEFVVRLVYLRPAADGSSLAAGWTIQPADDPAAFASLGRTIERLATGAGGPQGAADEDLQE